MSCLCLGPKGSGKTLLLNSIQNPGSINNTSHSVSTVGINIFTIKFPIVVPKENEIQVKKANQKKLIIVREIGGTMAPMWKNYLTDIDKIMYVVDTSNLCQISAAGVLLYTLLAEPRLQKCKILLVLTKMDLAYRQMRNEALLMLQMVKLKKQITQNITIVEASAISGLGIDKILDWLKI